MVNRLLEACDKPIESLLAEDSDSDNEDDEDEDDEEVEDPTKPHDIICIDDNLKFFYLLSTKLTSNDVALSFEGVYRSGYILWMINDNCN